MNYMIGFYSGTLQILSFPVLIFIKNDLKGDAAAFTNFTSAVQASWLFKPIYGYISDSIHPFKYRYPKIFLIKLTED